MLTGGGGDKICQNLADVICERSLSLYIRVNVNEGQNKFEVHILKYLAKMAINWQKIGQIPLGKTNGWAKLDYFSSNFLNARFLKTNRMVTTTIKVKSSISSISFSPDFGFCSSFFSEASHWQYCTYGPKTTLKMSGRVLAFPSNS